MTRDSFWDMLKGILMILVVVGHIVQLGNNSFSVATVNWIYTFHMPLFIFISGYFSNPKSKNYKKGIIRLAETFIIFQILHSLIGGFNSQSLIIPCFALWYLLSLVYWKILVGVIPESFLCANQKLLLLIMLILCFISGLLPVTTELSIQRTFAFMPFFVLGYYFRTVDYKKFLCRFKLVFPVCLLGLSVFSAYFVDQKLLGNLSGVQNFYANGVDFFVKSRIMILIGGLLVSFCVMRVLYIFGNSRVLTNIGQSTLHFYVYHVFFYLYLLKPLVGNGVLPNSYPWLTLYSLCTIIILYFTSKISIFTFLLNPIGNLYSTWKTRF